VLFALVMREMTSRYGRNAGGYVWAVIEPAGTVLLLTLAFTVIARYPPLGSDFALFFATGYLAFHVYLDISRAVGLAVRTNRNLLQFPVITILDTIIARFLLQAVTSVTSFAVIVGAFALASDTAIGLDVGQIALALALAALLGLGVGAVNNALFALSSTYEQVFGIVNRPLFLVSGVFFIVEQLPPNLQAVAWWNPLIHVTAIMRRGFYPFYEGDFVAPGAVALFGAALLALGALLTRAMRARLLEQ